MVDRSYWLLCFAAVLALSFALGPDLIDIFSRPIAPRSAQTIADSSADASAPPPLIAATLAGDIKAVRSHLASGTDPSSGPSHPFISTLTCK